jgi:predicted RNA binding protein YcfA (HicA-like mRNA interferase family)
MLRSWIRQSLAQRSEAAHLWTALGLITCLAFPLALGLALGSSGPERIIGIALDHDRKGTVKVRELIRLVEDDGWRVVSTEGSHRQYKHPWKQGEITVAGRPGSDVAPGTLNSILKHAQLRGRK